ncbi:MAG: hypothetical protein JNM72_12175 [Deltaproteobacteria bacterium]|nr:hypothetical protein [Deltaproteobacteria bacterium]
MPLTLTGIKDAVKLLLGAGVRNGPEGPEGLAALTEAWRAVLGDLEDDQLREAVRAWLTSSAFWPTPADLLRARPAARRLEVPGPVGPSPTAQRVARRLEALGERGREALKAAAELEVQLMREGNFALYEALCADLQALEQEFADGEGLSGSAFAGRLFARVAAHEATRAARQGAAVPPEASTGAAAGAPGPTDRAPQDGRHLRLVQP